MRSILIAAIVLATVLPGCLTPAEPQSADPTVSESTSPSPTNSTAPASNHTTAPPVNAAPVANLTADVMNGTAPLNVTFAINATDADLDNLSWTLDIDGDGTADYNGTDVPSDVLHQFTEVGNYTAILNVTDGEAFAEANLTIVVEVALPTGPNICHRPTAATGVIYVHSEGGDWVFRESNGMPGLQVANNHPIGDPLWINDAWIGCVDGDQMVN